MTVHRLHDRARGDGSPRWHGGDGAGADRARPGRATAGDDAPFVKG